MPDTDNFSVSVYEKPTVMTRHGLCSLYSSVYDPLGFVAPFVLVARLFYQHECTLGKDCDDDLEANNVLALKKWLGQLSDMKSKSVPRCMHHSDNVQDCQIE